MSYAFDLQAQVWHDHIRPHVKDEGLAMWFELLMFDMHSANHKVSSADGVFPGDGVNKDATVTRSARRLEEYVKSLEGDQGR